MKIGIIREGKIPPDARVPLTPEQCAAIPNAAGIEIVVESSEKRCFADSEYRDAGISVVQTANDSEILLGVKEVPISQLIPQKTYFFFSHTIKEQPYNRQLLRTILDRKIRLIDYEVLTNADGQRLIAFGRFAGMVGAHNALWTYGMRSSLFTLPRMKDARDYRAMQEVYRETDFPSVKIVLTGTGRVANGAAEVLSDMGIQKVTPANFLSGAFDHAVFTQLGENDYVRRKDGREFEPTGFFADPGAFESAFSPFIEGADIMINGIYWDNRAPAFFTAADMRLPSFNIQVIADVTCDIAPVSSIPSTLRASTIDNPVFGFDPHTEAETKAFDLEGIDMMTIDNLPNELPRDASHAFGQQFIALIMPELKKEKSTILDRATIARDGELTEHFRYLEEYVSAD